MIYSQGDEQTYIENYFSDKPVGKFIDIGAFHYEKFSNTRRLYELGWKGLMVEPATINYKAIAGHYEGDDRIHVLNVAVGDETKEIDFYECNGDAVSTSDILHMKKWGNAGVKYNKTKVQQVSVEDFFSQYCTPDVTFISLDVEGNNMSVFRRIPNSVFEQISSLVIEHDGMQQEIEARLHIFGFSAVYTNAENLIACKL